ncbi:hypothetical protein OUZ56_020376 [Daphnia magna]|uniref:Uncharacterized protein n=1 Tax=Daphnia magna TaxID=35525 RepID=A0ABQ9ZEB4_9CRUS|nr:hypothetical protein OUZ56_020376 [Daphnia magna]
MKQVTRKRMQHSMFHSRLGQRGKKEKEICHVPRQYHPVVSWSRVNHVETGAEPYDGRYEGHEGRRQLLWLKRRL